MTSTLLTAWPFASVPFAVIVMPFPSLEITIRPVMTAFPAFLKVFSVVLALIRVTAMVSPPFGAPVPEIGLSLPSKLVA